MIFFVPQDEQKELDEITAKRQKKGRNEEDAPAEEKTILHGTAILMTHAVNLFIYIFIKCEFIISYYIKSKCFLFF